MPIARLPPNRDCTVTVTYGPQWTSRLHVRNAVLKDTGWAYQMVNGSSIMATMLLPKGSDVLASFAAPDSREPAYASLIGVKPAITTVGEYANFRFSGNYMVTYQLGGQQTVIASSSSSVDRLSEFGLQIDKTTGEISSLPGQNVPTLTGNELFIVDYYFTKPAKANVWVYSYLEDAAGTFEFNGKKYIVDPKADAYTYDAGETAEITAKAIDGHTFVGSQLAQFGASGQWNILADGTFDFKVVDKVVSVIAQSGYLAFYNFYDVAAVAPQTSSVTVNRIYARGTSTTPSFENPDYSTTATATVEAGSNYVADITSEHSGYVLVPQSTTVAGCTFTTDEQGVVTVTNAQANETATITYHYYLKESSSVGPGPGPGPGPRPNPTPTPTPDPEPEPGIEIPEEQTPLTEAPDVAPVVEETTEGAAETIVIGDGETPLGDLPLTGISSNVALVILGSMAVLSLAAATVATLLFWRRKRAK